MRIRIGELKQQRNGIFQDQYGNQMIVDTQNRVGYLLENQQDKKKAILFMNRMMLPLCVGIMIAGFIHVVLGIIAGLLLLVGLHWYGYRVFLPSLSKYEDLPIVATKSFTERLKMEGMRRNVERLILFSAIAVFLPVNLFLQKEQLQVISFQQSYNQIFLIVFTFVVTIWAIVMVVIELLVISSMKKQK